MDHKFPVTCNLATRWDILSTTYNISFLCSENFAYINLSSILQSYIRQTYLILGKAIDQVFKMRDQVFKMMELMYFRTNLDSIALSRDLI